MNELIRSGKRLAEFAQLQAEFTAQRGLMDDLFPYIYVASKRMSLRAICRWLEENERIDISINAVAKAMHNQEKYWARLVEDVEPAARILADAHNVQPIEVIDDAVLFEQLEILPTRFRFMSDKDRESLDPEVLEHSEELQAVRHAAKVLRNRWFALPEEVRKQCRRHFATVFFDPDTPQEEDEDVLVAKRMTYETDEPDERG